jgi:hypothetical protein
LVGKLEGKRPLGRHKDIDIGGNIILKWILSKYNRRVWTGFIRLRTGIRGGFL